MLQITHAKSPMPLLIEKKGAFLNDHNRYNFKLPLTSVNQKEADLSIFYLRVIILEFLTSVDRFR